MSAKKRSGGVAAKAPRNLKQGPVEAPQTQQESLKTKILLVDDHPIVRERLAELIGQELDLAVCGEAEDARPT